MMCPLSPVGISCNERRGSIRISPSETVRKMLSTAADKKPAAAAMRGDAHHPDIRGTCFYPADQGTVVVVEVRGLPGGTDAAARAWFSYP